MKKHKIILCPNPFKDRNMETTRALAALLEQEGHTVCVSPEVLDGDTALLPQDMPFCELGEALKDAFLVVSLGGDGTIMHTARRLIGHEIPIIGVNLGTVGFLAELDRGGLAGIVSAAAGRFVVSPRMMLEVALERRGETVYHNYALNDVALHGIGQTIDMSARGDGRKILEFSGDGVVISSPTGSTAYSLSAGGPIVEPTAEDILVTPICAHALIARSFVLAPERVVSVQVSGLRCKAFISVDGGSFEVEDGDTLIVRKAPYKTLIATVGDKTFYDIVFEKLGDAK